MKFLPDTHLFDWLSILENATEIHTVETSIWYMLAKIGYDNLTLYSRYKGQNDDFSYMRDAIRPTWKLIQ